MTMKRFTIEQRQITVREFEITAPDEQTAYRWAEARDGEEENIEGVTVLSRTVPQDEVELCITEVDPSRCGTCGEFLGDTGHCVTVGCEGGRS